MIKIATVFSGIGSVEFALKRLNIDHEIVFACDNGNVLIEYDKNKEFDKVCSLKSTKEKQKYVEDLYNKQTNKHNFVKDSYLANYKLDEKSFYRDIILLDGKPYKGKVDLLVGGSPCQSFSIVGCQKGFNDRRGNLFFEFTRLVDEIQPEVFIYENVHGVLNNSHKQTWEIMKEEFSRLNYSIYPNILNAKDYGIPQNRRRLFVVGFKNKKVKFEMLPPKQLNFVMQDFLIESSDFGGMTYDSAGNIVFSKNGGVIDKQYFLSKLVGIYVMKSGTKNWSQKPETDLKIARTLLSTMGNHHRAGVDNYVTVNGKLRALSERECHRLMGFTDDYKIVVSKAQAYKQAGNSIVVDVMMNVLKSILNTGVIK